MWGVQKKPEVGPHFPGICYLVHGGGGAGGAGGRAHRAHLSQVSSSFSLLVSQEDVWPTRWHFYPVYLLLNDRTGLLKSYLLTLHRYGRLRLQENCLGVLYLASSHVPYPGNCFVLAHCHVVVCV